jgi:hypothetical protein
MSTSRDTTSVARSMSPCLRRRIGRVPLALLAPLALALPALVDRAGAQGMVNFNTRIPGGAGVGITTHIWGPSSTAAYLSLIGLGSNDSPSGTTPFGSASGMALIGAGGSGGWYGYATTWAQLIGAVGSNQPEYLLEPVGQTTTFRSGNALGLVVGITDTLSAVPPYTTTIPADAVAATFEIVAWDNHSGLYPTWAEALPAWQHQQIAAGRSAPFTVTAIGDGLANPPPDLNNDQGTNNGMRSFNLFYCSVTPLFVNTWPASDVTTTSVTLHGHAAGPIMPTPAWFQWGTTTNYGGLTPATNANYEYSTSVTGLTPGTTYHFRAVAANFYGPVYSGDQSFGSASVPLMINTGSGCWDTTNSNLSYTGGGSSANGSQSFILLQSADPTAPLTAWARVATNAATPGSFPIPRVGTAAPNYYRVKID